MSGPNIAVKMEDHIKKKDSHVRKLERLMEYLESSKEKKFTGYIKINFSQGVIGRIEKFEEILK